MFLLIDLQHAPMRKGATFIISSLLIFCSKKAEL